MICNSTKIGILDLLIKNIDIVFRKPSAFIFFGGTLKNLLKIENSRAWSIGEENRHSYRQCYNARYKLTFGWNTVHRNVSLHEN